MKLTKSNKGSMIGVEIECFISRERLDFYENDNCEYCEGSGDRYCEEHDEYETCQECNGNGTSNNSNSSIFKILRQRLENNGIKGIQVTDDGSLEHDDSDMQGFEVKVLTSIHNMDNLKKVCKILNSLGVEVNDSCGLHIHLDCRDIVDKRDRILQRGMRLENALPVLTKIVAPSRLNNTYCELKMEWQKYSAINLNTIHEHGTIEVRLHQGTTDFIKISQWIKLLYKVSRNRTMSVNVFETPNRFFLANGIANYARKYFNSRIKLFSTRMVNSDQTQERNGILVLDREAA